MSDLIYGFIVGVVFAGLMGFAIGGKLGMQEGVMKMQQQATQTECARYNPISAEFEWIGEKK